MPEAGRKGDNGSGHGCYPSSPAISGSPDVWIDGIQALRQGDALAAHACPNTVPHGRTVSGGSPTVFINGRPLARVGDAIDCGGEVELGSGTVIADEEGPRKVVGNKAQPPAWNPCMRNCMREANRKGQAFVRSGG